MEISFYGLERIAEKNKELIKPKDNKRPFLSDARALADEELVNKLASFNIEMNKDIFRQMTGDFLSAEEMFYRYIELETTKVEDEVEGWIWLCLVVLWERWAPEQPSLEMIDELIQDGYDQIEDDADELEDRNAAPICTMWLKAWPWVLEIMDKQGMKSLDDFDKKFRGTQGVWNWVQDLELELSNAGYEHPDFFKYRIQVAGEYLKRFPSENKIVIQNMKAAIADSYFNLGDEKKAVSLYEKYLSEDPTWGWGWTHYSDCYLLDWDNEPDYEKAEEILNRGLAVPGVEDREHIIERLAEVYRESAGEEDEWLDNNPAKVKLVIPSKKKKKKKKKKG